MGSSGSLIGGSGSGCGGSIGPGGTGTGGGSGRWSGGVRAARNGHETSFNRASRRATFSRTQCRAYAPQQANSLIVIVVLFELCLRAIAPSWHFVGAP